MSKIKGGQTPAKKGAEKRHADTMTKINALRAASDCLHDLIDFTKHVPDTMKPSPIKRAEAALSILVMVHQEGETTIMAAVRRFGMDKSNVSRHVKRLIEEGYVEVKGDESDKRLHVLSTTESGALIAQSILKSVSALLADKGHILDAANDLLARAGATS